MIIDISPRSTSGRPLPSGRDFQLDPSRHHHLRPLPLHQTSGLCLKHFLVAVCDPELRRQRSCRRIGAGRHAGDRQSDLSAARAGRRAHAERGSRLSGLRRDCRRKWASGDGETAAGADRAARLKIPAKDAERLSFSRNASRFAWHCS